MCKLFEVAVLSSVKAVSFGLNVIITGVTIAAAVSDATKTKKSEMEL